MRCVGCGCIAMAPICAVCKAESARAWDALSDGQRATLTSLVERWGMDAKKLPVGS